MCNWWHFSQTRSAFPRTREELPPLTRVTKAESTPLATLGVTGKYEARCLLSSSVISLENDSEICTVITGAQRGQGEVDKALRTSKVQRWVGRVQEAGAARDDSVDRVPREQNLRGDTIRTGLEKGTSKL